MASPFILDKNKDLGNHDKYLPLRDCYLAGLSISVGLQSRSLLRWSEW